MKNFLGIFLISLLFVTCKEPVKSDITVVATNSWTGAFARAAGAKNVVILAPFDMEHPSEYELRAADIPLVVNA